MTTVLITEVAAEDLARMIRTHSLPADSRERAQASLAALEKFPQLGAELRGRWASYRFVLGPWRWMILVYLYDEAADLVAVVTVQDARSSGAATSSA